MATTNATVIVENSGFIAEVMKGWYVPARPDEIQGESTAWYTSFWAFCSNYLTERFGKGWCLGAEQSINLLTGDWTVPRQLIVRTPKGGNKPLLLPHQTSIFDIRMDVPPASDIEVLDGVRIYSLASALIAVSPSAFQTQPLTLRTALAMVRDASEVLGRISTLVSGIKWQQAEIQIGTRAGCGHACQSMRQRH